MSVTKRLPFFFGAFAAAHALNPAISYSTVVSIVGVVVCLACARFGMHAIKPVDQTSFSFVCCPFFFVFVLLRCCRAAVVKRGQRRWKRSLARLALLRGENAL